MAAARRAERAASGRRRAAAVLLAAAWTAMPAVGPAAAVGPPVPGDSAPAAPDAAEAAQLARFTLTLGSARPYRFRLHYHGSRMPFRGPVCYAFAGYNETCRDPAIRWLTPATVIELWAPGGVPRDLLTGYTMLVRFPALSERQYRFVPETAPARDGGR